MDRAKILSKLGLLTSKPEPDVEDPLAAYTLKALTAVSRWFQTELYDVDRVPADGPAMMVGNHAIMGIDSWALMPELIKQTGRYPRALMLRSLFDKPWLSEILTELGAVPGSRDSACELLDDGNLVVVYPGGARDSMKGRSERYHLRWGERRGFAHVAIRTGAPICPVAAIGPDEVFPVLSNRGVLSLDFLGNEKIPLFLPFARRIPFRFWVGRPIDPPECSEDPERLDADAAEFAHVVQAELATLIQRGLEARDFE